MQIILFVILHFLICALLISGVLLCLRQKENKRPRIYLAVFAFVTAFELAYRLYTAYQTGTLVTVNQVLPIYVLISGILELLLLYLYPLEVIRPNWLTSKRLFLLFLPWLFIGGAGILVFPSIRNLSSFSEMIQYIEEFNVWFRLLLLLLLFLCFIPYTILLLRIPYKWQQNSVDNKWIYKYTIGIQVLGFLFSTVALTGSVPVSCIHLLYGMLFFLYVVYQELYLRLLPPLVNKSVVSPIVVDTAAPPSDSTEKDETAPCNPLWEKLKLQMDEQELWRNPDLTLEDLAKGLHTNRTTLSVIIQQQGNLGYSEFINRYRIEAFADAISSSKSVNTQQLFYEVGFRSKSTALRNFRLFMGCTPSEYIQQTAEQKKKSDHPDPGFSEE